MRNRISAVVSTASAALSKWVYPSVSPSSRLSPSVSPSSRLSPSVFPSSPFFSSVTKGTKDLRDVADEFSRSFWLKKDQLQACSIKLGTFKDPRDTLKKDQLQALSIKLGTFKDPRDRNRMARRMARLKKRQFYARWIKLGTFKDTRGAQRHPLRSYEWSYMEYVLSLVRRMDALPEQERFELGYRNSPLQPLMNNLEAQRYQTFKRETVKYMQYQRAICKALLDRVPDGTTTVLMVVGAGRGPLVRASLQAAEETGCKLKVYAVEKNPNAVVRLHRLVKLESWEGIVTIISCDMRYWDAPEKADIMVSELLGSFGDNGLSPECLDGAQRFLKPDGISIPSSYTSFLQPVRTAKLYNDVMSRKETAYVGKLYNVARLAPSQPVCTFHHPDYSTKKSNQRYKKLVFEIPSDTESGCVHGFAGYFDSVLYKDVHLGTEPSTATPNMFSWFAIFFPLRTPVCIKPGSALEVHFWRCCDSSKVWYEWCVTSPSPKPLWMYL